MRFWKLLEKLFWRIFWMNKDTILSYVFDIDDRDLIIIRDNNDCVLSRILIITRNYVSSYIWRRRYYRQSFLHDLHLAWKRDCSLINSANNKVFLLRKVVMRLIQGYKVLNICHLRSYMIVSCIWVCSLLWNIVTTKYVQEWYQILKQQLRWNKHRDFWYQWLKIVERRQNKSRSYWLKRSGHSPEDDLEDLSSFMNSLSIAKDLYLRCDL